MTAVPPAPSAAPARGATLEAVLERVTYVNEETGYTIARVATDRSGTDLLTVVGSLLGVQPGESLRLVEEEPGRLVEVPGLGPKRTAMIGTAWEEQKAIKEVMVFLQGVGVSTSLAVRIYKTFGDGSIAVVRTQPYRLAAEVWGSGSRPRTRSQRR